MDFLVFNVKNYHISRSLEYSNKNFLFSYMEPIITKMTERGQITIPEQIRKKLGFKKGDYFAASGVGDVVLKK